MPVSGLGNGCTAWQQGDKPVRPKGNQSWISLEDWCWSRSSNSLATWWEEPTHWKRSCCWERLKAGGDTNNRGWDGWVYHWLNGHEFEHTPGDSKGQGSLACCHPWDRKESDRQILATEPQRGARKLGSRWTVLQRLFWRPVGCGRMGWGSGSTPWAKGPSEVRGARGILVQLMMCRTFAVKGFPTRETTAGMWRGTIRRAVHRAEGWGPRTWLCWKRRQPESPCCLRLDQRAHRPGGQETSSEAKPFSLNPHQGSKTPAHYQGKVQPKSLKTRAGFAL